MIVKVDKLGLQTFVAEGVRLDFKGKTLPSFLDKAAGNLAKKFHESIPSYQPTPLVHLSALAQELGVANIYVKDESVRFGLNAFKAR